MSRDKFEECRKHLGRLNRHRVWEHNQEVVFEEKAKGGEGTITFQVEHPCIAIRPDSKTPPISWLASHNCADGAFVSFTPDGIELHIVEMKSRLGPSDWEEVKIQFIGMLYNALALKGVTHMPEFSSITCYIAFKLDRISVETSPTPISFKRGVGIASIKTQSPAIQSKSISDFRSGNVDIASQSVRLVKLQRDQNGNATLSLKA